MRICDSRVIKEVTKVQIHLEMTPTEWRHVLIAIEFSPARQPALDSALAFRDLVEQNLAEEGL